MTIYPYHMNKNPSAHYNCKRPSKRQLHADQDVTMTALSSILPASVPSGSHVIFEESSIFSRHQGRASLPRLNEVIAEGAIQYPDQDPLISRPAPVFFHSLGLVVKYGRSPEVDISEGQCLWALRRFLPEVPVPEIYGWSSEGSYVLLYMEMVKGTACTVEQSWPSMTEDEKAELWCSLQFLVSKLRTLSQGPHHGFVGKRYYDFTTDLKNIVPY